VQKTNRPGLGGCELQNLFPVLVEEKGKGYLAHESPRKRPFYFATLFPVFSGQIHTGKPNHFGRLQVIVYERSIACTPSSSVGVRALPDIFLSTNSLLLKVNRRFHKSVSLFFYPLPWD